MKNFRKAARGTLNYIKKDLREIVLPRPLDNPPDYRPLRKLTWKEEWKALCQGTNFYLDTWRSPKRQQGGGSKEAHQEPKRGKSQEELSLMEEITMAAKSSTSLQPAIMKLYRSQMNAFQLAITAFIQGYREGAAEKVDLSDIFSAPESTPTKNQAANPEREPVSQPAHNPSGATSQSGIAPEAGPNAAPQGPQTGPDAPFPSPSREHEGLQSGEPVIGGTDSGLPSTAGNLSAQRRSQQLQQAHGQTAHDSSKDDVSHSLRTFEEPVRHLEESEGQQRSSSSTLPESRSAFQAEHPGNVEETAPAFHLRSSEVKGHSTADLPAHESLLPSNAPANSGSNREDPEVLAALSHAEELAQSLLKPGGVTSAKRKQLEVAVAKAEAAMQASSNSEKNR